MTPALVTTDPLRHLSAWEKAQLAGEILSTYAYVRYVLRRRELPDAIATLRARGRRQAPELEGELPPLNRWRVAVAVTRLLDVLPADGRCLVRSLVTLTLLERRGVSSTLVIGITPGPDFKAHAWLERDGRPLLPAGEFKPLVTF